MVILIQHEKMELNEVLENVPKHLMNLVIDQPIIHTRLRIMRSGVCDRQMSGISAVAARIYLDGLKKRDQS